MLLAITNAIIKRITANIIDANTIPTQTPKAIFNTDNFFCVLGSGVSSGFCTPFLLFIASIIEFIITSIINIAAIAISK